VKFLLRNRKQFLVLNTVDNGTIELRDVRLILTPPPLSVVAQNIQLKYDFCFRSKK